MNPTPIQTASSGVKRPRGASGSSGRNRPGTRARLASRLGFNDIPTGSTRQNIPSPNEFPPLSFGLQDGYVFDTVPRTASDVGGGMTVTGILARPADVGTSPSTAATRDGTDMGMAMAWLSFAQPSMGTRSTSDSVATSVNDFMGGRRGEISLAEPQLPSYLEAPQFSRRGNLLPARPSTSGAATRTSNTTTPPNNSSPNPFSMNAAAGTSLTHRSAGYEISKSFDRLRTQGTHLGLAISPCFPKCKEDLVRHREERKNDAKDAMNKRIKEKEEIMRLKSMEGCEGALVKIKPAFDGKVFRDGLSGVLAQKTIWYHPNLDAKLPEIVDWPSLSEVKQAGRKKMGLPIPKYKAKKVMAGEEFGYFAGDRFGFATGDKRVVFNEDEIKQYGEMKNLFEEIGE